MTVTTGRRALRRTWRLVIVRCSPFASRPDVVLVDHVQDTCPVIRTMIAREIDQGDRRQQQMQDRVPCRRQVPGDQAVEDVEAGRVLGIEAAVLTSPLGSQPSWTAKTYLRMYARKNTGMATPSRMPTPTGCPASLHSGEPRSTEPEPRLRSRRSMRDRQLERGRPQSQHLLGDRPPGVDAVAEVELRPDEDLPYWTYHGWSSP